MPKRLNAMLWPILLLAHLFSCVSQSQQVEPADLPKDIVESDVGMIGEDSFASNFDEANQNFLDDNFSSDNALNFSMEGNANEFDMFDNAESINSSLANDTQTFGGDEALFSNEFATNNPSFDASVNDNSVLQTDDNLMGNSLGGENEFSQSELSTGPAIVDNAGFNDPMIPISTPSESQIPVAQENSAPSGSGVEPVSGEVMSSSSVSENDVLPTLHELTWVGYNYNEQEKVLRVEIITRGNPEFDVFEERNQAAQPELVIRFKQTNIRRKIRWDIDASEFRSPVAYIRMRRGQAQGVVDVVLTMRESVRPSFYAENSNIILNFKIPDRYYGADPVAGVQAVDQAERLGDAKLAIDFAEGSEMPRVSNLGPSLPAGGTEQPIENVLESEPPEENFDEQGFPMDFDATFQESEDSWRRFFPLHQFWHENRSVLAVAQDNLEDFTFEDSPEDFVIEEPVEQEADLAGENELGSGNNETANLDEGELAAEPSEAMNNASLGLENLNAESDIPINNTMNAGVTGSGGNLEANPALPADGMNTMANPGLNPANPIDSELAPADPLANEFGNQMLNASGVGNFSEMNAPELTNAAVNDFSQNLSNSGNGFAEIATQDLEGQTGSGSEQANYNGKLIEMEFTEAPLSIVFKSFSEETGNNFVFPKDVGDLSITIHFQGVPWDEALKAILETHSLGMVRVGRNIVRVDAIEKLTEYMKKLEEAKKFETRRIPTKILVMRLNNAKAEDILARLNTIIDQEKKVDPRIQASADVRTNSIVMEAPEYVLSKVKNIVERLDLATPQVEIASRIVEIQKNNTELIGVSWLNRALANFDPGRGLGFGSLNFPNNVISNFAVDPGIRQNPLVGNAQFRFGSINKFIDLDLILRMEERRGLTNVLQSNRVLVLDGQEASILAGNSKFFRPAAGGTVINQGDGGAGGGGADAAGLSEIKFNLSLNVKPQVTADGSVIMDLNIKSDTPGDPTGEALADKNTRELTTQMIRESGDTGVIGGIYDTSRRVTVTGVPILSDIPLIGALFRSTNTEENQTELLIMVTPTIVNGKRADAGESSGSEFASGISATPDDSFMGNGNEEDDVFGQQETLNLEGLE